MSRPPTPDEKREALAHFGQGGNNPKSAADDLVWALVNSKEFLHRH